MLDRVRVRERCLVVAVAGAATILFVSGPASAATRNAASCASSDVQSAVNSAASGDTVLVPSGSCNWGSTTVIVPNGKNITLQGAGVNATTITSNAGAVAIQVTFSSTRITGFTLACGTLQIDGEAFRVDHNSFTCATFGTGVFVRGARANDSPTGLVDHNTFLNMRVDVYGYPAVSLADVNNSLQWVEPLGLGTVEATYFEDNTFAHTAVSGARNVIDCQYSGRYVFRHNDVTDNWPEAHSKYGDGRACRKWEIYENSFHAVNNTGNYVAWLRGGTGVVFNNTWTDNGPGSFAVASISFDNVRSFANFGTYGICNGSAPIDGNVAGQSGWPCRDQIGRGADTSILSSSNPYPAQMSEPAYVWNNSCDLGNGPVTCGVNIVNGSDEHIKANRDYFVNAGPKPGYTPFIYPHPLQGGGTISGPASPTNLRITSTQ